MNFKILLFSIMSLSSYAATDWNQLISVAKKAEIETVTTSNLKFDIVKLPGNKVRFYGFKGVPSAEMKVVIHSNKKDLEKICNDYSVFKKSFQAELKINIPRMSDKIDFSLADGRNLNTSTLENKFEVGDVIAEQLADDVKFPWTLSSADYLKFGAQGVKVGFVQMLNNAIKDAEGEIAIDLSRFNGVACDLAAGYVKPNLNRTISFERALPESSYWINLENFTNIYREFWNEHPKLKSNSLEELKASELVLLGLSLADKNQDKDRIFEKSNRVTDFIEALKHKNSILSTTDISLVNPQEQWGQTFEYNIPKSTNVNQKIFLFNKKVEFSIEE